MQNETAACAIHAGLYLGRMAEHPKSMSSEVEHVSETSDIRML